jgi:DNA-binding NtrC family response regulator
VLARFIHNLSARASRPFQLVPLSTIDDALSCSELFGHVAGAFTGARQARDGLFASANGGSVFLDEIGKASLTVQSRLLHVVEHGVYRPVGADWERRVDVRVITASNVPLERLVNEDRFLYDLYARIQAFRIVLPPLRTRRADIPLLIERYLAHFARRMERRSAPTVSKALMEALCAAPWPTNVRQLATTLQRILIESDGCTELTLEHCPEDLAFLRAGWSEQPLTIDRIKKAIEDGNGISGAARLLGVDRRTIQRRLRSGNTTLVAQEAMSA